MKAVVEYFYALETYFVQRPHMYIMWCVIFLGIVRSVLTAIEEDDQNNGTCIDDDDEEVDQYEGYEDVQKMEVSLSYVH